MSKSVVAAYYWLTPLFWLLDVGLGWNVRAAGFEGEPGLKTMYYLLCIGCGAAIWLWPKATKLVALAEASVNILLVLLRIVIPYYRLIDQLASGKPAVDRAEIEAFEALSLFLGALIWAISFQMSAKSLGRG